MSKSIVDSPDREIGQYVMLGVGKTVGTNERGRVYGDLRDLNCNDWRSDDPDPYFKISDMHRLGWKFVAAIDEYNTLWQYVGAGYVVGAAGVGGN